MPDLFNSAPSKIKNENKPTERLSQPLADRMRPQNMTEIVGQDHILGKGKILRRAIEKDQLFSMIFWGPPGVGKTTLARAVANETRSVFYSFSAVTAGVKEVRQALEKAKFNLQKLRKRTVLFIDEIHRFNKAQQDALLHEVEDGTIYLFGATTENPSFEVIVPLLSRCRVFQLNPLNDAAVLALLDRAVAEDVHLAEKEIEFVSTAKKLLVQFASGDARMALNALELAVKICAPDKSGNIKITPEIVTEAFQSKALFYDKKGEYHYDVISAFIKSIRGSDPDAALYWLARMIHAGEDAKFIARRMVILASEDIGNADPQALVVATSGFTAVNYIGMPEGQLVLAQVATYLASAPKSNASYLGIKQALADIKNEKMQPVPLHIRNAPTGLMAELGYGKEYKYPHDYDGHFVEQNYLPEGIKDKIYYNPASQGYEKKLKEYLAWIWKKRKEKDTDDDK
ncbi:MAG TPA: replication-associated recombination protein A [Bacteroidetes bacterium]|nr:replication-associated recombination protein A [Bacteroidota bacterium]